MQEKEQSEMACCLFEATAEFHLGNYILKFIDSSILKNVFILVAFEESSGSN